MSTGRSVHVLSDGTARGTVVVDALLRQPIAGVVGMTLKIRLRRRVQEAVLEYRDGTTERVEVRPPPGKGGTK